MVNRLGYLGLGFYKDLGLDFNGVMVNMSIKVTLWWLVVRFIRRFRFNETRYSFLGIYWLGASHIRFNCRWLIIHCHFMKCDKTPIVPLCTI